MSRVWGRLWKISPVARTILVVCGAVFVASLVVGGDSGGLVARATVLVGLLVFAIALLRRQAREAGAPEQYVDEETKRYIRRTLVAAALIAAFVGSLYGGGVLWRAIF